MVFGSLLTGVVQLIMILGGLCMALSSSSVVGVWLGLELNMISFLPLLLGVRGSVLTYFYAQTLGTCLFMAGNTDFFIGGFILLGFGMKIGVLPYFTWFIDLLSNVEWGVFAFVMTIQKVHSLVLAVSSFWIEWLNMALLGVWSAGVVSVWLWCTWTNSWSSNVVNIKGSLAYLSVIDSAVLLMVLNQDFMLGCWYFLFYCVLVVLLVCGLSNDGWYWALMTLVSVLTLAGFPPLAGFWLKVNALEMLGVYDMADFPSGMLCVSISLFTQLVGYLLVFLSVWSRFRYDLLMNFSWGVVLPLSVALLFSALVL